MPIIAFYAVYRKSRKKEEKNENKSKKLTKRQYVFQNISNIYVFLVLNIVHSHQKIRFNSMKYLKISSADEKQKKMNSEL